MDPGMREVARDGATVRARAGHQGVEGPASAVGSDEGDTHPVGEDEG